MHPVFIFVFASERMPLIKEVVFLLMINKAVGVVE
ncbi:Uncharacterised protein [Vibrio cholerae]|uniref:Uncharacterized protein n=1 Tax=Vibrio cholerae TaxID=666 RepID=A0A655QHQ6_VIBCL|nr:Uncharacterised protein [Vibrio cholerae]CSB89652.1 Uncharacterised protein [Vibrio cholerae]